MTHVGSNSCYNAGCRQQVCRTAHARHVHHYRQGIADGTISPMVPAGPVRDHVRMLVAADEPYAHVAARAGVGKSTVNTLLYGRRVRGVHGPLIAMHPDTAARLLRLEPQCGKQRIDILGTRRRVQALACDGWTTRALAARLGFKVTYILDAKTEAVHRDRAAKIAALYDELCSIGAPAGAGGVYARKAAARRGYAPPEAWHETTIDDPSARPWQQRPQIVDEVLVRRAASGHVAWSALNSGERRDVVKTMLEAGASRSQIARTLVISGDTVARMVAQLRPAGSP